MILFGIPISKPGKWSQPRFQVALSTNFFGSHWRKPGSTPCPDLVRTPLLVRLRPSDPKVSQRSPELAKITVQRPQNPRRKSLIPVFGIQRCRLSPDHVKKAEEEEKEEEGHKFAGSSPSLCPTDRPRHKQGRKPSSSLASQ